MYGIMIMEDEFRSVSLQIAEYDKWSCQVVQIKLIEEKHKGQFISIWCLSGLNIGSLDISLSKNIWINTVDTMEKKIRLVEKKYVRKTQFSTSHPTDFFYHQIG